MLVCRRLSRNRVELSNIDHPVSIKIDGDELDRSYSQSLSQDSARTELLLKEMGGYYHCILMNLVVLGVRHRQKLEQDPCRPIPAEAVLNNHQEIYHLAPLLLALEMLPGFRRRDDPSSVLQVFQAKGRSVVVAISQSE